MVVILKDVKDILSKDLTMTQRGILISLILSKDNDPLITWAKFKNSCKVKDHKQDLIFLHEKGLIKWNGYKAAKKSSIESGLESKVFECIDFLNKVCGRNFSKTSKTSTSSLVNRLKDYTIEDVKLVIGNRFEAWGDNDTMKIHLTPSTLFRPSNFEKYLEDAKRTRLGEKHLAASNIQLNDGDEITPEIVETFIDSNPYNIKIYRTNGDGRLLGNGTNTVRTGEQIKKTFKLNSKFELTEHRYFYVQK